MNKRFCTFLLPLCLLLFSDVINSKPLDIKNIPSASLGEKEFREGFDSKLDVSSSGMIMGLVLGKGTGLKTLNELFIDKSGLPNSNIFCLNSRSTDGLFWAENTFKVKGKQAIWRVSPISKKYKDRLKKYGTKNLVTVAEFVTSSKEKACETVDSVYVPLIDPYDPAQKQLTLYLNSSHLHTEIELLVPVKASEKGQTIKGSCKEAKDDDSAIYDRTCSIELPSLKTGGISELKLFVEKPPFETIEFTEKIALPKR